MKESKFYQQYCKEIHQFIALAVKEDIGTGDHSSLSCLDPQVESKVQIVAKEPGIIAGVELAYLIFQSINPNIKMIFLKQDSTPVNKGDTLLTIVGPQLDLLKAERLVLNCLQRMSGIATLTHRLVQKISHTHCQLLDTRKTTPNFRYAEKWGVKIGGGENHRMGLFDTLMIKDNHIDFNGSITKTLEKTEQYLNQKKLPLKTIVETRSLKEVKECFSFPWIHRILLDNMSTTELRKAVQFIDGRFLTEASGNINEKNLVAIAETGVDYASLGALTHSANIIDMSLLKA